MSLSEKTIEESNELIPNKQGIPGASKDSPKVRAAIRKWKSDKVIAKKNPSFAYWQNASSCASL